MYQPIQNLLSILKKTEKKYDIDKICRAYVFAAKLHEGQFRVSGDPYISHPIAVAEIVAGLEFTSTTLTPACLSTRQA